MNRKTTIRIQNPYLKFSAAHFTIFSATSRERLHGHNFHVSADITAEVGANGLCFDYNIMKRRMHALCERLDEYTLIPEDSPHLAIGENEQEYEVTFDGQCMRLLKTDTLLLPVRNVTAEELSHLLLKQMLADNIAAKHKISAMKVSVASSPGQNAATHWQLERGVL
ncbi:MAG: 6-carboxytetrahydropterin synthase [Pseudomonadota bacterium]